MSPSRSLQNKGQCGRRAAARAGSVLGFALKSRQFQLEFLRFWQVLFRSENLPNSPKLALRLKGILHCRPCGFAMTPAFASKNGGKRYQFYACINALKRGRQACPSRYLPALEIENLVVEQIREIAANRRSSREADDALAPFRDHSVWEALPATEQARLVQGLVQRVEYDGREGQSRNYFPLF